MNSISIQADISCHPCPFNKNCEHLSCHKYIRPEDIYNAMRFVLGESGELLPGNKLDYWISGRDVFGLQHFVPLLKRDIRKREYFFEIKRLTWALSLLDGLDPDKDWAQIYYDY